MEEDKDLVNPYWSFLTIDLCVANSIIGFRFLWTCVTCVEKLEGARTWRDWGQEIDSCALVKTESRDDFWAKYLFLSESIHLSTTNLS